MFSRKALQIVSHMMKAIWMKDNKEARNKHNKSFLKQHTVNLIFVKKTYVWVYKVEIFHMKLQILISKLNFY